MHLSKLMTSGKNFQHLPIFKGMCIPSWFYSRMHCGCPRVAKMKTDSRQQQTQHPMMVAVDFTELHPPTTSLLFSQLHPVQVLACNNRTAVHTQLLTDVKPHLSPVSPLRQSHHSGNCTTECGIDADDPCLRHCLGHSFRSPC